MMRPNEISMTAADLKQRFGTAIRNKRSEMNISQEELADRAGLHRTYVSDVERGARNLSLESIAKLAHALDLSVSKLFEGATGPNGCEHLVEILLVEDDRDDIDLTLHAFREARIINPVHVVHDGAEALDFLFPKRPTSEKSELPKLGVILLDLNLPKIGGLEVLRRIKTDKRTRSIPVVVLTSSNRDRDIAECRRLGVESYIVKPVGFQNFSKVTSNLEMEWALVKPWRWISGATARTAK